MDQRKILFVCLGNICRSPLAEGILRNLAEQRGLTHLVTTDSAGTGGWHQGDPPDPRSITVGRTHGVDVAGLRARKLKVEDFNAFERLLGEVNTAYSNEDEAGLRQRTTPEMFGYFDEDLSDNARRGVVDRVSDVKLLQGDLSQAWHEGNADYATVAMRFSLINALYDRKSGNVVEGSATQTQEVSEYWTFLRERGAAWKLSGIQQAA